MIKQISFIIFTITLTLCQFRIPPGGPHLLLGWLIALAFYGESPLGILWAFGIGALHSFPLASPNPWSLVFFILTYAILRRQRYFLGRDHFLPRTICLMSSSLALDLIDWWQLAEYQPTFEKILMPLIGHAGLTTLTGLLLLSLARRFSKPLGLRQTVWDF